MDRTQANHQMSTNRQRLDSWKEIAAYLRRDIRTVQRWEKQEALPVHRHLHDERGTAYAYADEIDEWLRNRSQRIDEAAATDGASLARPPAESFLTQIEQAYKEPAKALRLIAVSLAAVVGLIVMWRLWPSPPDTNPLSALSIVFAPSERIREWGPDMALSPDGSTLAYVTEGGREGGELKVRRIDQLAARTVPGTRANWGPFFSPDGRSIGFNRAGQLMKVPVDGGPAVTLVSPIAFTGAADWGADDHIVYATNTPDGTHGLFRVSANGGAPQLITALDGSADEAYWLTPQSVSNGRLILCTLARTRSEGARFQVVAVSVSTGERRLLIDDARHALYIGDGVLVYWRGGALFATRFDADRGEVSGPHVAAWDDVWERVRLRAWASAAGTLVYWPHAQVAHRLVWVDRTGKQEPLPLPPAMYHAPRVSPDGRRIAYAIGHDFDSDVWTHDLTTGATVRLTSDGRSAVPLWTPDGTRLIISRLRARGRDLAQLSADGTGALDAVPLPASFLPGASLLPATWADGGRTLLARQSNTEAKPVIWALPLDGSREPRAITPSTAYAHISPDGRWIAYEASDHIYVAPFPAGRPEWKVSTDGGALPVWARSGRELFYRRRDAIMAVPVTLGSTFTAGPPRPLFEVPFYEAEPGSPNYDVAADDQRFLMVLPASTGGPNRLHVVQGWRTEILRRLNDSR